MPTLVQEAGTWRRVYERGKLVGFVQGLICGAVATVVVGCLIFRFIFVR